MNQDVGGGPGDRLDLGQHVSERAAPSYDATEVHRDVDFFPEVVALSLEFLAQVCIFGQRVPELAFGTISLGDVL